MSEEVITRKTRCPECGRTTDAFLTQLDNGRWHFNPHVRLSGSPDRTENTGDPCPAERGEWRLTGAYPKTSGVWEDAWKKSNGEGL